MAPLFALLEPRSVVLIGASNGETVAGAVTANLLLSRPSGSIFLISSDGSLPPADHRYGFIDDLPIIPDLAVICTPATAVVEAFDQAGRKGIKTAVVITADPGGSDPATPLKKLLKDVGGRHNCRFLGPGSVGISMPAIGLNASWMGNRLASGPLALVSQSGSMAAGVVEWAISRGIGLSRVISMGDEADIGIDEILGCLAADTRTTGIVLYLRSLNRGRAFVSSARAVARIKPILGLKPRESQIFQQAQEPSVEQDAVYDAVFTRAGLLRVHDTAEWFDAAESLTRARPLRGGKFAILANGCGPAHLAASLMSAEGLLASFHHKTVATLQKLLSNGMQVANPLVLGPEATAEHYANALAALHDDAGIAAALVIFSSSPSNSIAAVARVIAHAAKHARLHLSVCCFGPTIDEKIREVLAGANVALYDMPEKAARAFIHLDRYRRNQEALRQIPPSRRQELARVAANSSGGGVASEHALSLSDEAESTAFLRAYGKIWHAIKAQRALLDEDESNSVLRAYGLPVRQVSESKLRPLPLSLAITNDPVFGRVILVTAGCQRTVALPPLNRELTKDFAADARAVLRMVTGTEVNVDSIQDSAIRLANMAVELPEIVMLELSSIGTDGGDLIFHGARIRVAAPEHASNHLSIHPYPRDLEERMRLKGGQEVLIRPIRIEDIRLYQKMLNKISTEELFLRFCGLFRDVTQAIPTELLANLIHFDYSRDITFIAIGAGSRGEAEALGVVDALILPSREQAEYSILLRSDMAGIGLGKALMTKIIGYCRAQRVSSVFGLVLRRNARMLGLCTRLGFTKATDGHDDDMVKVVLSL
jgi:acetyltransferase